MAAWGWSRSSAGPPPPWHINVECYSYPRLLAPVSSPSASLHHHLCAPVQSPRSVGSFWVVIGQESQETFVGTPRRPAQWKHSESWWMSTDHCPTSSNRWRPAQTAGQLEPGWSGQQTAFTVINVSMLEMWLVVVKINLMTIKPPGSKTMLM